MNLYRQALKTIQEVVDEARQDTLSESTVMSLATADETGQPSVRTVYLHAVVDSGLIFFTNRNSRKAHQLAANPRAAACFYWQPLGRQIQVEGIVQRLNDGEADAYWDQRGRDSQLVAWASGQREPGESREQFQRRLSEYRQQFDFQRQVPRPRHWSGYCLIPERIEIWKASWRYPKQRVCYQKTLDGWSVTHLNP